MCTILTVKYFLKTAEEYLTETEAEATDAESVMTEKSNTESELSSNYGKLKHSDSLLLLTQVRFVMFAEPTCLFCMKTLKYFTNELF